tara:strand:+ start:784 stop:984 length:201 start_codon:yes stop_codon:yes gene_type:complete
MTIEEKVLRNVMEDMQKELEVFEKVYEKDDNFHEDFSHISYTIYLNSVARLKEVLFRMSINNKESA